jgi:hypothetical protein
MSDSHILQPSSILSKKKVDVRKTLMWILLGLGIAVATASIISFACAASPTFPSEAEPRIISPVLLPTVEEGPDSPVSIDPIREVMIRDIIGVWKLAFRDDRAKPKDKRRKKFREYAEHLANAVLMYQEEPVEVNGRMVQLPKHRSSHLIMAYIAFKESSLRPRIVGKTKWKEVGMMQLHGRALAGYSKKQVRYDTQLGIELGVRWATAMLYECPSSKWKVKRRPDKWKNYDWLRPLTMYGAGPGRALRPDGKCKVFDFARRRVSKIGTYGARIDRARRRGISL